jgi:hypothetical protein
VKFIKPNVTTAFQVRVFQFGFTPAAIRLICQIWSKPSGTDKNTGKDIRAGKPNMIAAPRATKEKMMKVL